MNNTEDFLWNDHVHCFMTFMELGTVAKAAEKLRVSQPAVTKQLKKFEEQLPYPVFFIEGRNKLPTSFGLELFKWLKQSQVESQKNFQSLISIFGNESEMTLRIGLRRELVMEVSKYIEFEGKVLYLHLTGEETLEALKNRDIDMAITQSVPRSQEFVRSELFTDNSTLFASECELIVHKKWTALHGENWYQKREFYYETPLLLYRDPPLFLNLWMEHFSFSLEELNPKIICEDWNVLAKLAEQGKGYSIFPSDMVERNEDLCLHKIPFSIVKPLPFYAYYNPEFGQNKVFHAFLKRTQKNIRERNKR